MEDLLNPQVQPYMDIYCNLVTAPSAVVTDTFVETRGIATPSGSTYNLSAANLCKNQIVNSTVSGQVINLPTMSSVYTYLQNNVTNPVPFNACMEFVVLNNSSGGGPSSVSISGDTAWGIVSSQTVSGGAIILPANTTSRCYAVIGASGGYIVV